MPAFAFFGAFVAMELQQIQRHRIEDFSELATAGIDEESHGGNERRQRLDNRPRLQHVHRPRALGVKHQADRVGTGFDRGQCIFDAGNAADLAANG